MLKANYHTHTYLCGHAVGAAKDYVKKAEELGFEEIGISDHAHTPKEFMTDAEYEKNALSQIMTDDDFENIYLKDVLDAKKSSKIKVLLGLETEYIPKYHEHFAKLREKVEYLVLGEHFFEHSGKFYSSYEDVDETSINYYTDTVIKGMATGLYTILAHPDLFMYNYTSKKGTRIFDKLCEECSRKIIEAAIKYDVYLELNANGIRNTKYFFPEFSGGYLYPRTEFWKIVKEYNPKIVFGADAHTPEALSNDTVKEALEFAKKLDIKFCDFVTLKPMPTN